MYPQPPTQKHLIGMRMLAMMVALMMFITLLSIGAHFMLDWITSVTDQINNSLTAQTQA